MQKTRNQFPRRPRGAPKGNVNALRTGAYTRDEMQRRRDCRTLLVSVRRVLKTMKEVDAISCGCPGV